MPSWPPVVRFGSQCCGEEPQSRVWVLCALELGPQAAPQPCPVILPNLLLAPQQCRKEHVNGCMMSSPTSRNTAVLVMAHTGILFGFRERRGADLLWEVGLPQGQGMARGRH